MNGNQNNNQNQNPSPYSGGPQFNTDNQGQGGWGKKIRQWLNKYGSSVILPIIALLILAGGIYLYASQQEQANNLSESQQPSATTTATDLTSSTTKETKKETTEEQIDITQKEQEKEENSQETKKTTETQQDLGQITKTAKAGEGITHLARKAAQDYLTNNPQGKKLTKEQKVYIEDYLQNKTGSRSLEIGEQISFSKKQIQDAINASQQLTQNQLDNIKPYSQNINW